MLRARVCVCVCSKSKSYSQPRSGESLQRCFKHAQGVTFTHRHYTGAKWARARTLWWGASCRDSCRTVSPAARGRLRRRLTAYVLFSDQVDRGSGTETATAALQAEEGEAGAREVEKYVFEGWVESVMGE